jgi:hypothetical protein
MWFDKIGIKVSEASAVCICRVDDGGSRFPEILSTHLYTT